MINNSILVENKTDNLETNNTTEKMYSLPSNGAEKMDTLVGNYPCGDGIIASKNVGGLFRERNRCRELGKVRDL